MKRLRNLRNTVRGSLSRAMLITLLIAPLLGWSQDAKPFVQVAVGNDQYAVPLLDGDKGTIFDYVFRNPGFDANDPLTMDYEIAIRGLLDPDPGIFYGLSIMDFGAPSIFGFFFFTPIVPTGPATTVNASVSGGLTDFTGDGVSLSLVNSTLQTSDLYFPVTDMGVGVGTAASHGPGAAGSYYTYGAFTAGPASGPTGPWSGLGVTTSFGLSGGGDILSLTGSAEVRTATVTVPERGLGLVEGIILAGLVVGASRLRIHAGLAQARN